MGPRAICLLRRYWERLKMMAWAGEYYGETLQEERGDSQGNPLFPNIFNVVVDAVVLLWEYLVAGREGGDSREDEGDMAQTARRTIWD